VDVVRTDADHQKMKRFVAWDRWSIENLPDNISKVVTEIDEMGHVTREIGFDAEGLIVYRAPLRANNRLERGLFDGALIDLQVESGSACTEDEFEQMWEGSLKFRHSG
jgi:hypothetical protein